MTARQTIIADNFTDFRRHPVPIGHALITATSSGAAQTIYTVPDGVAVELRRFSVANVSNGSVDLNLHTIPSGGAIGDGNAEFIGLVVHAKTAVDLIDLMRGYYEAGTVFAAYASSADHLTLRGSAEQLL